jgi:hypothetical protein
VSNSIDSGNLFQGEVWKELIANVKTKNSTLHLLGLLSDGNVHSHIDHLKALVAAAKKEGVSKVRIHTLLDGRDVPEKSALEYVRPFEKFLAEERRCSCPQGRNGHNIHQENLKRNSGVTNTQRTGAKIYDRIKNIKKYNANNLKKYRRKNIFLLEV